MFSYSPGGQLSSTSHYDDESRRDRRDLYFAPETAFRGARDEAVEEDEEPVSALDLRIGKATESISIFDDKNVLSSTNSSFGPALPRPGQARILAENPAPTPYILPPRRRSTSNFVDAAAPEPNNLRMFRPPASKITPRHMDRRKRFLEAALASASSPSPPPPVIAPLAGIDSLRRDILLPPHFMMDSVKQHRAKLEAAVDQSKRPNASMVSNPIVPAIHPGQLLWNPDSPYRYEVPHYLQQHPLPGDRSRTPIFEFPGQRSRSPDLLRQPFHPRAYDYPPFHTTKFQFPKNPSALNSFSNNQVQTVDDRVIKREALSPPPLTAFPRSPPSPNPRPFAPGSFLDQERFRFRLRGSPAAGYSSDPVEYKSSYLHHVLQRQRQQTHEAAEELLRHRYPASATTLASATQSVSHPQDDEVSELDQRLRMIEHDSRVLESENSRQSRSPTPSPMPVYLNLSPDRAATSTPVRSTNSVLPLNLSKATSSHDNSDAHLHFSVDHETSQHRSNPTPTFSAASPSSQRHSNATPPAFNFNALSPSSRSSSPPPLGASQSFAISYSFRL